MKTNILFFKDYSNNIVYNNVKKYSPKIIVYFSGNKHTTFQLDLWIPVIKKSDFKFIIILREHHHYLKLNDTSLPIVFLKNTLAVEKISTITSIKAALYLSNVGKNIHLIRSNNIKHIFIGHGDSDKSSSANNIMKLYHHMFVAGEAHIDRMKANNIFVPKNYFLKIGRPNLELEINNNSYAIDGKLNILYAPTWEGYFENSSYSSLNKINEIINNYISKNKNKINFLFRPHPHTGVVNNNLLDTAYKISLLNINNDGIYNNLYDCFKFCDIMITDISGILSDFLYFNKPIILYEPEFIKNIKKECPISECCYILNSSTNLRDLIGEIRTNDYLLEKRKEMKTYVMGNSDSSNDKGRRFFEALNKIINP